MKAPFDHTRKVMWITSLLVLATLVLAACQSGEIPATGVTATAPAMNTATTAPEPTATEAAMEATEPAASMDEAELSVVDDPNYGPILVGNNGMTLYMFTRDEPNMVNCAGDCLVQWPPLITQGDPVLGDGVNPDLVGTAELPDGSLIVTYNEMPLYYWVGDTEPGQTTGQNVGGVWFVVSPEGDVIGMEESMETPEMGATEPSASMDEAELSVVDDPNYGEILVGNNGMTLYMFTRDEENMVNCAGDCLVNWPPLITQGEPVLGEGVDEALVGTADLPDGQKIVTYNGMPLYYWVNDKEPGDTTGQDVGGVWYVVSPEGEVIDTKPPESESSMPDEMADEEAEISVAIDPALGEILVGSNGMTLYMFTKDEENKVNCSGDCLVNWPPLVTQGNPVLGEGVDEALVGTADLPDGGKIVTYNGMPLYYWVNDKEPGETTGQGVGGVWYVVSPEGEVIGQ